MKYAKSDEKVMREQALARLRAQLLRIANNDGDYVTAIPGLSVHRRNDQTEPLPCIYDLGLALTVSGRKQVSGGGESFAYGGGTGLFASVDMPVVTRVTQASAEHPYLGVMLRLDPRVVLQVAADVPLSRRAKTTRQAALVQAELDADVIDAFARLVALVEEPALMPAVAPLIQQEIVARILLSDLGPQILHLNTGASPGRHIAQTMAWMKQHYNTPINIDGLAEQAHMSATTFRQHFKAVAGMSPLQYLKQIRLQEARQLMLNDGLDASTSGLQVGYESVSQFSREYARLFGAPPMRDVRAQRDAASARLS